MPRTMEFICDDETHAYIEKHILPHCDDNLKGWYIELVDPDDHRDGLIEWVFHVLAEERRDLYDRMKAWRRKRQQREREGWGA